jgi:putative ABC transport system substrate-binding protein
MGPLVARAQKPAIPAIGFVSTRSAKDSEPNMVAFGRGLAEAGYFEHDNVAIEYRWAEGHNNRVPALMADLVRRPVLVIAAASTDVAIAAKQTTATIPIVFMSGADPVKYRLVERLDRPGGNLTGVSLLIILLVPKQFELLHELLPKATIGLLVPPNRDGAIELDTQAAAEGLGHKLVVVRVGTENDFDPAFTSLMRQQVGALFVPSDPFFNSHAEQLVALAARHALPAIYPLREYVVSGGLMSYGTSLTDAFRQVGVYAGRILKGTRPADLPVQQATKVELVINLKTARALGLTLPPSLLARADEVIE